MIVLAVSLSSSLCAGEEPGQKTPRPPRGYELIAAEGWWWGIAKGSQHPRAKLTELITQRLTDIRRRLGRAGETSVLVIRTPNRSGFRKVTQELGGGDPENWVAALAFPARGIVVLDTQRLQGLPLKRGEIITHELAHVVLGEVGPHVPRWYHEGMAQWLGGERLEAEWVRLLAFHAADDGLSPFSELTRFPSESQRETSLLYAQSHHYILFLNQLFGTEIHLAILDQLAAGRPFFEAFESAVEVPFDEVQSQWIDSLARQHRWWSFLFGGFNFFQGVALLAVLAFFVQRTRRRRALVLMTEEELREGKSGTATDPRFDEPDPPGELVREE